MCSACDPKIGKWHGEFPRQSLAEGGWVKERHGKLLWHKREIEHWLGRSIVSGVLTLTSLPVPDG
jgi:hypothetical protein